MVLGVPRAEGVRQRPLQYLETTEVGGRVLYQLAPLQNCIASGNVKALQDVVVHRST